MSSRLWVTAIIIAALAGASTRATAGAKSYVSAQVNTWGNTISIYGGLGDTRNTANTSEYIECGTNSTTGYCLFRNTAGTYYSCSTTNAGMIEVIRSMSGDGSINFSYDTTTGACTYMLSYASSRAQPKNP
jgi:hypothetical protein